MADGEYSDYVAEAIRRGNGSGRKRAADHSFGNSGQVHMPAVLAPVALLPNNQNPLLTASEEYVCLEGDEEEADLYEKIIKDTTHDCIYCKGGVACSEHAKTELERIHALEEENYGLKSDRANFQIISDEYERSVKNPLLLQQKIKSLREKKQPEEEIPDWTPEKVSKHYIRDGLYPHREIGGDIRVCSLIQNELRFHGIKKKTDQGKQLDLDNIKTWSMLSKRKEDLIKTYHSLYPNLAKRQKKTNGEQGKIPGAKQT